MEEKNKRNADEVHLSYTFNAPRKAVFKAWTDPAQLAEWYAPHGCTILFKTLDVRKGGSFLSCVSNPQFGECWCKGVYTEVVSPERIEYTMIVSDEHGNTVDPVSAGMHADWPLETKVSVTFTEDNGKTTVTLHQTVSQKLAKETGAYPSWIQMLEILEQLLMRDKI
ncbi:MAG TPA: SRPBCC domain-containing protein [Bacteroidia bacterium]|nr:SRPBCC domain-containing protein [Bacteroidia bacterium]